MKKRKMPEMLLSASGPPRKNKAAFLEIKTRIKLEEIKMSRETLYRRIPEQGKHPAFSRKNPGAISGAALDDLTNRPAGTSDFVPVVITEEEYLLEQRKAAFVVNLAEIGVDYASARILHWWETKALPKLYYETISAAKRKVSLWWKCVWDSMRKTKPDTASTEAEGLSNGANPAIVLYTDLDGAYRKYAVNMTSEEAQMELFEAFVLQYISMIKFQNLANAQIVDIDGSIISGKDVIKRLSNPSIINSINRMLSQNPSFLEEWQAKALSEALGRKLVQNNRFIPIRQAELASPIA